MTLIDTYAVVIEIPNRVLRRRIATFCAHGKQIKSTLQISGIPPFVCLGK